MLGRGTKGGGWAVAGRPRFDTRRAAILASLADGSASIPLLAQSLGVSEMTIRRDLELLEHEGVLLRVKGGAVPRVSRSYEPPMAQRSQASPEAKARIGRAAAALIREGETGVIDVGTTALAVAEALKGRRGLVLVTASMPAAMALANEPEIRVMVTGGMVRNGELSLVGARAVDCFTDYNCDVAFLGVAGVDIANGLTEYNVDDAEVKRATVRSARRTVLTVDATKLGKVAFARVCPFDAVDTIVTDAQAGHPFLRGARERGVEVVCV